MTITSINRNVPAYNKFHSNSNLQSQNKSSELSLPAKSSVAKNQYFNKENILAFAGSVMGVSLVLAGMMKHQKIKNPMKLNYRVQEMLMMAGCANVGGILLSSIGKNSHEKRKKWTEGAFQFTLTSSPLICVDTILKQFGKSSKRIINNNITKIAASIGGVYVGSNFALWIANKLRKQSPVKQKERKLKPIDMIANFDDAVAIMVLAKIPFADKIQIKRLLPFIYSFCGFRSGTGNTRS